MIDALRVNNATIVYNDSRDIDSADNIVGPLKISNSINSNPKSGKNCSTGLSSLGFNLVSDDSCLLKSTALKLSDGPNEPPPGSIPLPDPDDKDQIEFPCLFINTDENNGTLTLSFTRYWGTLGEISFNYGLESDLASIDNDFTEISGKLVWVDGESGAKNIEINILDDEEFEGVEHFYL